MLCRPSPQRSKSCFSVLHKLVFLMRLFGYVYFLVPMAKHACKMALASNIQKYTFGIALGPCKQCFIMFSQGLKLFSSSNI
jgi:hypothetical protein